MAKKKSLIGWTYAHWNLFYIVGKEARDLQMPMIIKTREDSGFRKPKKVRITIEEMT